MKENNVIKVSKDTTINLISQYVIAQHLYNDIYTYRKKQDKACLDLSSEILKPVSKRVVRKLLYYISMFIEVLSDKNGDIYKAPLDDVERYYIKYTDWEDNEFGETVSFVNTTFVDVNIYSDRAYEFYKFYKDILKDLSENKEEVLAAIVKWDRNLTIKSVESEVMKIAHNIDMIMK